MYPWDSMERADDSPRYRKFQGRSIRNINDLKELDPFKLTGSNSQKHDFAEEPPLLRTFTRLSLLDLKLSDIASLF